MLHAGPSSRVSRAIRGGILKRVGQPHETGFKWGALARSGPGQGGGVKLQGKLLDPGSNGGDLLEDSRRAYALYGVLLPLLKAPLGGPKSKPVLLKEFGSRHAALEGELSGLMTQAIYQEDDAVADLRPWKPVPLMAAMVVLTLL